MSMSALTKLTPQPKSLVSKPTRSHSASPNPPSHLPVNPLEPATLVAISSYKPYLIYHHRGAEVIARSTPCLCGLCGKIRPVFSCLNRNRLFQNKINSLG